MLSIFFWFLIFEVIIFAKTWFECNSIEPIKSMISCSLYFLSKDLTSLTLNSPVVNVPVLSKTTVSDFANTSMYFSSLIRMLLFAKVLIVAKYATGVEITNAHGQDANKTYNPAFNQSCQLSLLMMIGITIINTAATTTIGV